MRKYPRFPRDGCGPGLAIVQWIVTAHGGSVNISSQPGTLATVTVLLPLGAAGKKPWQPKPALPTK
jgi:signal transduction histidine kinase